MNARRVSPLTLVLACSLTTWIGWTCPLAAKSSFLNAWHARYPGSLSGDNGSCSLCHGPSSFSTFNGYGFNVFQQLQSGKSVDAALAAIEANDSDLDPGGFSNLEEILADAQPGWTVGANNTIYRSGGPSQTDQVPPADVVGNIDPATASPAIVVTPLTLAFGDVTVGQTSSLVVTLENVGDGDLTVGDLLLLGSADIDFNPAAPVAPLVVVPGTAVSIPLDYTPSDLGDDVGTLRVSSDDADQSVVDVSLSGSGVPPLVPDIDVTPLTLDFGTVVVGESVTGIVTLQNLGPVTLEVKEFVLSGSADFQISSNTLSAPFLLLGGGVIEVALDYLPSDPGRDDGVLQVVSDDPDEPSVEISLVGNAVAPLVPDIDVSPLSLDFGATTVGDTSTSVLVVRNVGDGAVTVTDILLSGSLEFDFGVALPVLPFDVSPGGLVEVPLLYRPTDAGPDSGALQVLSNDPDEPSVDVSLLGSGSVPFVPDIDVRPLEYDFGTVTVSSSTSTSIAIHNVGESDLAINAVVLGGSSDFELQASLQEWPVTVAPGGVIEVSVAYAPADVGPDAGALEIQSDDPDEPTIRVALLGNAAAPPLPILAVDPNAVDFGSIAIGTTATDNVTIRNAGSAELVIDELRLSGSVHFQLGASSPLLPLALGMGDSVDVPLEYTPTEAISEVGELSVVSNDMNEGTAHVALSARGISGLTDVDLTGLRVRKSHRLCPRTRPLDLVLTVTASGASGGVQVVSIVGIQNGVAVYDEAVELTMTTGTDSMKIPLPSFTPTDVGVIYWEAMVDDDDADVDSLTATTSVVRGRCKNSEATDGDVTADGEADVGALDGASDDLSDLDRDVESETE